MSAVIFMVIHSLSHVQIIVSQYERWSTAGCFWWGCRHITASPNRLGDHIKTTKQFISFSPIQSICISLLCHALSSFSHCIPHGSPSIHELVWTRRSPTWHMFQTGAKAKCNGWIDSVKVCKTVEDNANNHYYCDYYHWKWRPVTF